MFGEIWAFVEGSVDEVGGRIADLADATDDVVDHGHQAVDDWGGADHVPEFDVGDWVLAAGDAETWAVPEPVSELGEHWVEAQQPWLVEPLEEMTQAESATGFGDALWRLDNPVGGRLERLYETATGEQVTNPGGWLGEIVDEWAGDTAPTPTGDAWTSPVTPPLHPDDVRIHGDDEGLDDGAEADEFEFIEAQVPGSSQTWWTYEGATDAAAATQESLDELAADGVDSERLEGVAASAIQEIETQQHGEETAAATAAAAAQQHYEEAGLGGGTSQSQLEGAVHDADGDGFPIDPHDLAAMTEMRPPTQDEGTDAWAGEDAAGAEEYWKSPPADRPDEYEDLDSEPDEDAPGMEGYAIVIDPDDPATAAFLQAKLEESFEEEGDQLSEETIAFSEEVIARHAAEAESAAALEAALAAQEFEESGAMASSAEDPGIGRDLEIGVHHGAEDIENLTDELFDDLG